MMGTEGWDDEIEVMDLYLASYYLVRGCVVARVSCIPTGKDYRCSIVMKGASELIYSAQAEFFNNRATVNLLAFRDAYNQVNGLLRQAKKSYERATRGGEL
jgi:hypothetical protein